MRTHLCRSVPARFLVAVWFVCVLLFVCGQAVAGETIEVAIYDHSDGSANGPKNLMKILTPEAGFECERIAPAEIRSGELQPFDVLIVPGGSGSKQARKLEEKGREQVREFVRAGGGFIGICAGAYLASSEYDWSLRLINTRVLDRKHWARGKGTVKLSISTVGKDIFNVETDELEVQYNQGPLLALAIEPDLPAYQPLALFETEVAKKGAPEGVMRGTTAIAAGDFGAGRVLCYSPHPEKPGGPHHLISSGVRWAAGEATPAEKVAEAELVR